MFAHKVIRQVGPSLDRRALLRGIGVDPDAAVDRSVMVADEDYYAFLERIALDDPRAVDLPLRVGASMELDDYGAMGFAWKSAENLRGSWERAVRYAFVLTSVSAYEIEDAREGAWLMLRREGPRRLGLQLSNEASIASLAAISQQVTTAPLRLLAVSFEHGAPERVDAHEAHFGCPVHFDAPRDGLLVASENLLHQNRLADPGMVRFFDAHLDKELAELDDDHSLEHRVRSHVARSLSDGAPTVSSTAKRLGMSARSLQRRLAASGQSYQQLIDEARRQLAERLLRQTDYSLSEVAFLTGFSEQSAFTRAFKRWAGQTPRSYRLAARPSDPPTR